MLALASVRRYNDAVRRTKNEDALAAVHRASQKRKDTMNELGNKIAKKRKDLGMTQTEMADRLSVTRQTVGRWETGAVLPDIDKIGDIASLLGVSCDYLLKDEVEEEASSAAAQKPVSRLLQAAEGKTVRLTFMDEEADADLFDKDCRIEAFEGGWIKVSAVTKKGAIEKLIPLSSVLSLEIRE